MVQDPGKSVPGLPPAKQEQPPGKDVPGKPSTAPGKVEQTAPGKAEAPKPAPAKTGQELATAPAKDEIVPQPVLPLQTPPPAAQGVAVAPAAEPFRIGSILQPALLLVAILVVGALILAWLKRSREKTEQLATTTTASDQLATFRHAYEEGEMSPEEFKKVKARLTEKLREPDPMSMPPQVRPPRDDETPTTGDEIG